MSNKYFLPKTSKEGLLITNIFIATMLGISRQNTNYLINKWELVPFAQEKNRKYYKFSDFLRVFYGQVKYTIDDSIHRSIFDTYIYLDRKLRSEKSDF